MRKGCVALLLLATGSSSLTGLTGCSRAFWRQQADRDSYELLGERVGDPRWNPPRLDITPDPRSRFFDAYDPDKGPLPPDDPAAHQFLHQVSWIPGYKGWHKFGDLLSNENPHWLAAYGLSPDMLQAGPDGRPRFELPELKDLTLAQIIELSYIHNREYQTEIENVYLSALAVSFERFQFNVRYLGIGGREPSSDLGYEVVPGQSRNLAFNNRFGISQLMPSGGQWIVEFANSTLWLFSGGGPQTTTASALSFSLVQPLLFGAGRKVVLEALTQTERNALYSVRDLARFRQQFFTDTVSGGPSTGYLGLLQQTQVIANQKDNITRVLEQLDVITTLASQRPEGQVDVVPLEQLPAGIVIPEELAGRLVYDADKKELRWRGPMSDAEEQTLFGLSEDLKWREAAERLAQLVRPESYTQSVLQLKSRLLGLRISLADSERRYQDSLDRYKMQIGLPTDMRISINRQMLKQFELIDPELYALEDEVKKYIGVWAKLDEEKSTTEQIRAVISGLENLRDQVEKRGMDLLQSDVERVTQILPARLKTLASDEDRRRVTRSVARDQEIFNGIKRDFGEFAVSLKLVSDNAKKGELKKEQRAEVIRRIAVLRDDLYRVVKNLQGVETNLRVELIQIAEFQYGMEDAVQIGLENRVDLMNARARVVDARRKVEVAANRLEAVLNVRIEGDVRTRPGNQPLDFRGSQSSLRAGLGFVAPLDQILERNNYRVAQIEYQRARRAYMEAEDNVKLQIRTAWRQLAVLKINFETARQQLRNASAEFDNAVELTAAPNQPVGQNSGLTLLNALSSILNAQNDLIRIWVEFERNRLNIYRDIGMMDIDATGLWTDPVYQNSPQPLPPPLLSLRSSGDQKPTAALPGNIARSAPLRILEMEARQAGQETRRDAAPLVRPASVVLPPSTQKNDKNDNFQLPRRTD